MRLLRAQKETASCFESLDCFIGLRTGAGPSTIKAGNANATPDRRIVAAMRDGFTVLSEIDSSTILRSYGVPIVESTIVSTADEACTAAAKAGYPVISKPCHPVSLINRNMDSLQSISPTIRG